MRRLRPSAAKVWLNCPGSVHLSEQVPELESEYTIRGTALHEKAAIAMRKKFHIGGSGDTLEKTPYQFSNNDDKDVNEYIQYIFGITKGIFGRHRATVKVEHRISIDSLPPMEPEKFRLAFVGEPPINGTIDFVAYTDDILLIADYKTGFKKVYARNNPQLYYYALGMILALERINLPKTIYIAVCQPSQKHFDLTNIKAEELIKWAWSTYEPIMNALNKDNTVAGEHCHYCPARGACRTYLLSELNKGEPTNDDESYED